MPHPFFVPPAGFFDWLIAISLIVLMGYFCATAQVGTLKHNRFPAAVTGCVCGLFMYWGFEWSWSAFMDPGDNAVLAIVELLLGAVIIVVAFGVAGLGVPSSEARKKAIEDEKKELERERKEFEKFEK